MTPLERPWENHVCKLDVMIACMFQDVELKLSMDRTLHQNIFALTSLILNNK